ncbi:MAG: Ig-like domain-containing protein, partial [Gemmatirosa sp.]
RLVIGQSVRAKAQVFSAGGDERLADRLSWRSSAPAVARVDGDGMITALTPGSATITATSGPANGTVSVTVLRGAIASLSLTPSRLEARTGDVIRFTPEAKDAAGRAIAGVQPTWSFSPGQGLIGQDGAFVGYEAGDYIVTASYGTRSTSAVVRLAERDVRRPMTVVGRLPRTRFTTEEVWLHPTAKIAYLGSGSGGDVMYTIDISNPAAPVVTDSIVSNTRRVNDVMTTADGKHLVFTREGASDRRNGIVVASLEDPLHPKVLSEYTETVTAGVHSAFVYTQPKHGTHVYLTNDGTGAFHILDLNDPKHPKEVAVWKTPRPEFAGDAGRSLHDVDVQDGLAYLSYWNDGLVILDVGNGIKGGSPSNPVLVSQHKYDLNDMYRQVEAAGGPGFIRGTHTAWRHKNYVFIADEVFPSSGVEGAKDAAQGRAYGRLQVIDVSDLNNPKSVAFYEPEHGGVHNVWVAGDTLYMGAYNAGFRAFDVSGELRGDLRAQAREMVHVHTGDLQGKVQNTPMTWGVVVRDGLAYVNDMYNGLWIVRMGPSKAVQPKVMQ